MRTMKRMKFIQWKSILIVFLVLTSMLFIGCQCGSTSTDMGESDGWTFVIAKGSDFTISTEEGEVLRMQDMRVLELPDGNEYTYQTNAVPSNRYKYESVEEEIDSRQKLSIVSIINNRFKECGVTGEGIRSISIESSTQVSFQGSDMQFDVFLPVQGSGLGKYGCMHFFGRSVEKAEFVLNENKVEFRGITPGEMNISFAGDTANIPFMCVQLTEESGTLDFSDVDKGYVILEENGEYMRVDVASE